MENKEGEVGIYGKDLKLKVTYCMVCKEANDEDLLVLCDKCNNAYHTYCMVDYFRRLYL